MNPKALDQLCVTVMSFGYKEGPPPQANMVFDVRFLQNPYWVLELRSLTGLDLPVRAFVLQQPAAGGFLDSLAGLLVDILPYFVELEILDFSIAFGCTGGQHRSTALAEELSGRLIEVLPNVRVVRWHRELGLKLEGTAVAVERHYRPEEPRDEGDGGLK